MAKQATWIGLLQGVQPGIQIDEFDATSVEVALSQLPPLTDPVGRHDILAFVPALAVATQPVNDDPIDAGMRVCPNIRALLPGSPLCERMLTCIDEHHWRLSPNEMAARLVMEGKRQIDQLASRIAAARDSHPAAKDWPIALISDPEGLRIPTVNGDAPRGVVLPERWQAKSSCPDAGMIAPPNTIVATPQGWHHWDNGRWLRRATGSDLPPIT
jgi:hypothetical protein